ncbi:hypothetical protein [Pelagovum pacificum]|uniref:DUF3887 domain-containing protein n=1 Tax=Pelagovum pacificum TaxID=2588711 RepID=A0A5C5GDR0_9RHOB|nr:hypothetical protein [Pelagovum pacificum]QQA44753.1 hypothetical protein I8N54_09360 [Pelagovum pacificum]TNY32139.1 hypothetical protein FHY64_02235 [Pelagovum pacificum]
MTMTRAIAAALLTLFPLGAEAQIRDGVFGDYAAYDAYVTDTVMHRRFEDFVQNLGGRDEYTDNELAAAVGGLMRAFPRDFEEGRVMKLVPLENGFFQEARAFWVGDAYGFYYALLHDNGEHIVVLNFTLNTDVDVILQKF